MGTFLKVYERLLNRYPLITSSVQTGLLMASGDVIAQTVVEKTPVWKINLVRTGEFAFMGCFLVGPTLTTWYRFLAVRFGDSGRTAVLKKVACDQLLFAPTFIGVFLGALGVVKRSTYQENVAEIKRNYADIVISNYKFWPWVQLGNFYMTPLRYQILVVQVMAIFWNTYLSWKTQGFAKQIDLLEIKRN